MNSFDENSFVHEMLEWRKKALLNVPETLPQEEREAVWIADDIAYTDQLMAKEYEKDIEVLGWGGDDVQALVKWESHESIETIKRANYKKFMSLENRARRNFDKMIDALKAQWSLTYPEKDDVSEDEIFGSETFLAIQKLRERFTRPLPKRGNTNYRQNRSEAILAFWLVLEAAGYSMKAASRISAHAFELAGKESGDFEKRKEAIYQVIRESR